MTITIAHSTTISGHFSANCMFIFHKKEVQTVILRCLTGLNIDWFKKFCLRCKWRPRACLANFQNITTDKWTFYYHIWPFFANCMVIFHKNEIQTVILRCLMSLNLNWFKSYDTKYKYFHFFFFLWFCAKTEVCIFCMFVFFVIIFVPIKIWTP